MAMVPGTFSISGLATELGKDRRTIAKIVRDIEPTHADGKSKFYRLADVVAAMRSGGSPGLDANEELARLRKAQADKTELEVATLEARLIPSEAVEKAVSDMVIAARAKLLSMPQKMARQVVAEVGAGDEKVVQALLEESIHEALAELAELKAADIGS